MDTVTYRLFHPEPTAEELSARMDCLSSDSLRAPLSSARAVLQTHTQFALNAFT